MLNQKCHFIYKTSSLIKKNVKGLMEVAKYRCIFAENLCNDMKIKSGYIMLILSAVFALSSCKENEDKKMVGASVMQSLEIISTNLSYPKKINVYLPVGYDTENEYPAIFMECGRQWEEFEYKHFIDSLIETGTIEPVIVVCAQENNMKITGTDRPYYEAEFAEMVVKGDEPLEKINRNYSAFYLNEFIPAMESKFAISKEKDSRIFYGTLFSADFGISLGMKQSDLFGEYWCFSPAQSNMEIYGMIKGKTRFNICWGNKETVNDDNYYPALLSGIRKRGGVVDDWTFDGRPSGMHWKNAFKECLVEKFGYKTEE